MLSNLLVVIAVAVGVMLTWHWLFGHRSRRSATAFTPGDEHTERDLDTLIRQNRKVDAIRVYRALHGVDLKTAREAVERRAARSRKR